MSLDTCALVVQTCSDNQLKVCVINLSNVEFLDDTEESVNVPALLSILQKVPFISPVNLANWLAEHSRELEATPLVISFAGTWQELKATERFLLIPTKVCPRKRRRRRHGGKTLVTQG